MTAESKPSTVPVDPRIVYCRCAYAQVVPEDVKQEVLAGIAASGRGFEAVADLCEMAARRDPQLKALAGDDRPLKIAACWPRAVEGLFRLADAPLPTHGVEILNMRTDPAPKVLANILEQPADATATEADA